MRVGRFQGWVGEVGRLMVKIVIMVRRIVMDRWLGERTFGSQVEDLPDRLSILGLMMT